MARAVTLELRFIHRASIAYAGQAIWLGVHKRWFLERNLSDIRQGGASPTNLVSAPGPDTTAPGRACGHTHQ